MAPRPQPRSSQPVGIDYGDPSQLDPRYGPGAQVARVNPTDPRYATPGSQAGPSIQPYSPPAKSNVPPAVTAPATKKVGSPEEDEILKWLQEFYDEFNSPFDPNDPYIKSILDNAQASTAQRAGNAGVFGPYSQNLAQQAYIKSAAGLQDSRQARAQAALAMLTNYKTNKRDFDYQKAQDSYAHEMDKWKYDQQHNSDLWRGIGGGLGAIGGGALGALGGPAGIAAGAATGFGLGQQIGGGAFQAFGSGGSPPPTWNPPRGGY